VNLGLSRLIAASFGLCAFVVAIISGLAVENPAGQTLTTALVVMIVCNLVGLGIGVVAERVVSDHVSALTTPVSSATSTSPAPGGQGDDAALSTIQPNRQRKT
jgi:putative Mn2+ efflux pump MntP